MTVGVIEKSSSLLGCFSIHFGSHDTVFRFLLSPGGAVFHDVFVSPLTSNLRDTKSEFTKGFACGSIESGFPRTLLHVLSVFFLLSGGLGVGKRSKYRAL